MNRTVASSGADLSMGPLLHRRAQKEKARDLDGLLSGLSAGRGALRPSEAM
jgi:hypothetical protein